MEPALGRKLSDSLERISAKVEKIQSQQAREEEQAVQIAAAIDRLSVLIEKLEPHLARTNTPESYPELKDRKTGQTIATIIYGARVAGQIITIVATGLQLIQDNINTTLAEDNKNGSSGDSLTTSQNFASMLQPLNQIIQEMAKNSSANNLGTVKTAPEPEVGNSPSSMSDHFPPAADEIDQ